MSMSSTIPPPPLNLRDGYPSIGSTMGVMYLAAMFSTALWGVGTSLTFYYFKNYRQDRPWMKTFVFILWLLDTVHETLLVGSVYRYLITGFGNFSWSVHLDKFLIFALLDGGFICLMVQLIFLMRIWRLSGKNLWLGGIVGCLVISQFVGTCAYFGRAIQVQTFPELRPSMEIPRIVNAISAAADTSIATCLVVLLHRNRSGFKRSDTTINLLIVFAVNTGLLTGLCAILGLILGLVVEDSLLFMFFFLLIARLYMNSLLASLNSRNSLRHMLTRTQSTFAVSDLPTYGLRSNSSETNWVDCGLSSPATPPPIPPQEQANTHPVRVPPTAIDQIIDGLFGEESRRTFDLEDPRKYPNSDPIPAKVGDTL